MVSKSILIVGLGNPGKKYEMTRHNLGFMIVKAFAEKHGWAFKKERFLKGEVALGREDEAQIIMLLPDTYMNLSGQAVRKTVDFFKVALSDLIVVCDDIALDFGVIRYRDKGSSGGHKGLKDIEVQLGTQEYSRLRAGIGDRECGLLEDYVLSPFIEEEKIRLPEVIKEGVGFLEKWLVHQKIKV